MKIPITVLAGICLSTSFLTAEENRLPDIVAHRGASHQAPENTVSAVRLAWEEGADATEVDVRLSSDGKIVVCHDDTTLRTGGVELVVKDTSLAEIQKLEAGAWKGIQWKGEPFPTLTEVFAAIPDGKRILVEIKCGVEIMPALRPVIEKSGLEADQILFISFNADVIAACRKQFPKMKSFWLTGFEESEEGKGDWTPRIDSILKTLKETNASGLDCNAHDVVDAEFVEKLRSAGHEFHVWTVDDPAVAKRFAELGVDSITTNRPAGLRAELRGE
jgi:glycerophosphoryl diester phosphodiesterase